MRFVLIAFCTALALLSAAAADGLTRKSWNYEAGYSPEDADDLSFYSLMDSLQFEGRFQAWFLLGEPVVNCTARWVNAQNAMNLDVNAGADDRKFLARPQAGEIEVYNVVVVAQAPDPRDATFGRGSAKYIAAICDAGIVAQNGRDGFNVAGSPSWNEFLCAMPSVYSGVFDENRDISAKDRCRAMGGAWVSETDAKKIAREGLKFDRFEILSAEVTGAAVIRRIEKQAWREDSAAFKRRRTEAFSARLQDGTLEGVNRQIGFVQSLPPLPQENPSTEQLKAYEDAYQAAIEASGADDAGFKEEWRAKERALVEKQLDHMRNKAADVGKQEGALARYRADLEKRAENAPEDADPMKEYRTASLIPYKDGYYCGLKRPDGSIAVQATYIDGSFEINGDYYRCGMKLWANGSPRIEFGAYVMMKPHKKQYYHNGEQYSKNRYLVDLWNDDGRPIVQGVFADYALILPRFEEFGLIVFRDPYGYDQELTLYSLPLQRVLLYEHAASVGYVLQFYSLVEHEGRAAVIVRQSSGDWRCRNGEMSGGKGRYFFLDTEQYSGEACFPEKAVPDGDIRIRD